jgi:hypothetical protein
MMVDRNGDRITVKIERERGDPRGDSADRLRALRELQSSAER